MMSQNGRNIRTKRLVYIYTILAQLMCLLLGYHLAVISGAMLILVETFDLDIVWQQLIATSSIVGGAVVLFPSGYLVHLFGRKKAILGANIIVSVGSIVTAAAQGKETILLGRFITGIGIGIPSLAVPMYVSECAPANIRGRLGSLTQVMINTGIFLSAVMGGAFNSVQSGWRYVFATSCAIGVVQFVGFLFAPETPRWLMDKGRVDEAREVLERLRNDPDEIQAEIEDIQRTIRDSKKNRSEQAQQSPALIRVFRTPPVRRSLLLSVVLAMIFQITGIPAVLAYSGSIIKMAGFESGNAAWLATLPFAVQLVATFISTCLVDRVGRKILFIGAHIGILLALVILGLGFFLSSVNSSTINTGIMETYSNGTNITACQYGTCHECISSTLERCAFCYDVISRGTCLPLFENGSAMGGRCFEGSAVNQTEFKLDGDFCPSPYSWIPVLGLSLYLLAFGGGAGVIWIIISEVFPLWARSTCSSVATATIWIFQIIASMTFLSLAYAISIHGIFWLYAVCALFAIIYTCIFLPETRGKRLEDVETLFMTTEEQTALFEATI